MTESDKINHAFVADFHPSYYMMHKYWARKPHNVVAEYIKAYSQERDIILDPFCGSGVAPIEAIKHGRKAIGIDLNPMAIFISRMTIKPIDLNKYKSAFKKIQNKVKDEILELYETKCPECGEVRHINQTIWRNGKPELIEYKCEKCAEGRKKYVEKNPTDEDIEKIQEIKQREIPHWYPTNELYYPDGISFKKKEKNEDISDLFTKRNLIALSILWNKIEEISEGDVKELMKFTFTGQLHISSKMLPARESAGGPAWTEPSFWAPVDFWERNVWNNFETRFEKVLRGKKKAKEKIGYYKEAENVFELLNGDANILWICGDALEELREIDKNEIDFVFTDPSYGESIQYGELCYLWASWLGFGENYLNKMKTDEVLINEKQNKDLNEYYNMLLAIFKEISRVGKLNSIMTVTFHNPKFKIRNTLERACFVGGYELEKVLWQPPAQVPSMKSRLQPYGSVQGDFYFRFKNTKITDTERIEDKEEFERIVIDTAKKIVAERSEPTGMNIVTNSIEPALVKHGFPFSTETSITDVILEEDEFVIIDKDGNEINKNRTKKIEDKTLWFKNPRKYLLDKVPLNERVEKAVHSLLLRERKIDFTDVMKELYTRFLNALTPSRLSVKSVLEEYAKKEKGGLWKVNLRAETEERKHSQIIGKLAEVGHNLGYQIWVGKKEQRDQFRGKPLSKVCDFRDLVLPEIQEEKMERIRNIDVLWIENNEIRSSFEVEITTGITDGIVRGSNIPYNVDRNILVPKSRENLLKQKLEAPMIKTRLREYSWKFIFFEDFEELFNKKREEIKLSEFKNISKSPNSLKKREIKQALIRDFE